MDKFEAIKDIQLFARNLTLTMMYTKNKNKTGQIDNTNNLNVDIVDTIISSGIDLIDRVDLDLLLLN